MELAYNEQTSQPNSTSSTQRSKPYCCMVQNPSGLRRLCWKEYMHPGTMTIGRQPIRSQQAGRYAEEKMEFDRPYAEKPQRTHHQRGSRTCETPLESAGVSDQGTPGGVLRRKCERNVTAGENWKGRPGQCKMETGSRQPILHQ